MGRYFEALTEPEVEREYACPVCGRLLGGHEDVFTIDAGDRVAGCCRCLRARSVGDWCEARMEERERGCID